jgi:putative alpha-1,2-mannosidase
MQITGQTTFLILSPWFPHMTIQLGNGKTLNITVKRTGGDRDKAYHVQWLKLNGKTWDKAWLTWEDISEGATLEFVQGTSEDVWPLPSGPPPPSPASVHFQKP